MDHARHRKLSGKRLHKRAVGVGLLTPQAVMVVSSDDSPTPLSRCYRRYPPKECNTISPPRNRHQNGDVLPLFRGPRRRQLSQKSLWIRHICGGVGAWANRETAILPRWQQFAEPATAKMPSPSSACVQRHPSQQVAVCAVLQASHGATGRLALTCPFQPAYCRPKRTVALLQGGGFLVRWSSCGKGGLSLRFSPLGYSGRKGGADLHCFDWLQLPTSVGGGLARRGRTA